MKFCGKIGYVNTVETEDSAYEPVYTERVYYGDVTRLTSRWESNEHSTNDNIKISNQISIVADPYAYDHFSEIRYVEFMNTKWKITSIEVNRPRLILTLGGEYNE